MKRWTTLMCVGFLGHLYTAFVAMSLWNWFLASALNVHDISFWQMYGVIMLASIVIAQEDLAFKHDSQWELSERGFEVCVPEEKRAEYHEALHVIKQNMTGLWALTGGKIIGNTVTLLLGWLIHVFAAA